MNRLVRPEALAVKLNTDTEVQLMFALSRPFIWLRNRVLSVCPRPRVK